VKKEAGRFYLSKREISLSPEKSGVYFLYQNGGILVYIGKALSLKKRVAQHDLDKAFLYVGYELCHWSRARKLEKELLNLYKKEDSQLPYFNKLG